MCETFDNNCTALHFGTVKHIDHNRHGSWSNVRDGAYLKIIRGGGTRLPKHTFHKKTVYIFLPSNIQQPMCSAECLMGNRAFKDTAKRPCLNVICSLDELMTHTQSTFTMLAYKCKVYKCVMRNMMTF